MNTYCKIYLGALLCLSALVGCGQQTTTDKASAKGSEYLLTAEPAGALDVMDLREQAQDGQGVVVVGRLRSGGNQFVDGRAAFVLIDERVLPTCSEDHCGPNCQCAQELAEASTMVKFVDAAGRVLAVDARELLGLKEQQTVVIRGIARRDPSGNVSIAADGVFVRR